MDDVTKMASISSPFPVDEEISLLKISKGEFHFHDVVANPFLLSFSSYSQ